MPRLAARFLIRLAAASLILFLAASLPGRAEEVTDWPEIASPGTHILAPNTRAWLTPREPGVYRLGLDGAGILSIARFRTADGRSDGSDRLDELARSGSAYEIGTFPEILLEPGNSYVLQIGAAAPRRLEFTLIEPLSRSAAETGTAPLALAPGQDRLFALDAPVKRPLSASRSPLRIEAITTPGAALDLQIGNQPIGPGGLFPRILTEGETLQLRGKLLPDGRAPLVLLRTRLPADELDEQEPGPTKAGTLGPDGLVQQGILLANRDKDVFEFTLAGPARLALSVSLGAPAKVAATLISTGKGPDLSLLRLSAEGREARRGGLSLPPGQYRLQIEGETPRPTPYTLRLTPDARADRLTDGEPDDIPERARALAPGTALIGHLSPQDPDFAAFTIPASGRLWEIRAVQGVETLLLQRETGETIGQWTTSMGALALPLALPPGRYTLRLRGAGRYALRLSDAGPLPEGFETEPNDTDAAAQRIFPGSRVEGGFLLGGDRDLFEFTTPTETPLRLRFTGPDDGPAIVDLHLSDGRKIRADILPEHGEISAAFPFPPGRTGIDIRAGATGISGRWQLALERSDSPEPGEPGGTLALPADGQIAGSIGGFDGRDEIFIPLPEEEAEGALIAACSGALSAVALRSYGDDKRLIAPAPGTAGVLAYDPALGGGVKLRLEAAGEPGTYACTIAFAPAAAGQAAPRFSTLSHTEAADEAADGAAEGAARTPLRPGTRVAGSFGEGDRADKLRIEPAAPGFSALDCRDGSDAPLPRNRLRTEAESPLEDALRSKSVLASGAHVFLAASAAMDLEIRAPNGGGDWSCTLIGPGAFRPPSAMGPAAPFTAPLERGRDAGTEAALTYDPGAALRLLSGGDPDWQSETQIRNDLDVALGLSGLETPFRAFSRAGQSAALSLSLENRGDAREITLSLSALGDGWRAVPETKTATLAAAARTTIPVLLEIPPMQSPSTQPALRITAASGTARRSATFPVTLDPLAADSAPSRFWQASTRLRGGLNPLHYAFGARVIKADGKDVSEADAAKIFAPLHDGLALHTGQNPGWKTRETIFRLAEPAPVIGLALQLRSANSRGTWPDRLTLELSADGTAWQPAFDITPKATHLPQIFELPGVIEASHARLIRHGCRTDPACKATTLPEIGLVAAPAWRFSGPVNIAAPALGGHVIRGGQRGGSEAAEALFGGAWNIDLLQPSRPALLPPATAKRGTMAEAVIGFHANRAARISAIEWRAHEDAEASLEGARISVSTIGPGGPWQAAGILPAPGPGPGTPTSRLDLAAPLWARAVRLEFPRHARERRSLPDQILIWEDPAAPPIHGLWEDDRPDAGLEASASAPPPAAPAPSGGADRQRAVPLAMGAQIRSSVQLERNADFWRITVPDGPPRQLTLRLPGPFLPEVAARLSGPDGTEVALSRSRAEDGGTTLAAITRPGVHILEIFEPPRSVAILWDTSGSVAAYIPKTLAAVRVWAQSLQPGRDKLQLLPFGVDKPLLAAFAQSPSEIIPALIDLPATSSSDAEQALKIASEALAGQEGQRGIVVFTDGETAQIKDLWGSLLKARPKVIALSIDTSDIEAERIMKDWATLNNGHFQRITGFAGLADGMDLAAAIFRAPKGYALTASLETLQEPEGTARLALAAAAPDAAEANPPTGAIQVILDASGSMLQRLPGGKRRIATAHEALAGLVRETLPAGTPFAFRAFGLQKDACRSELILPLAPLDPAAAEAAIRAVPAINLARTAIADSLARAARDLADQAPPRVVVLLTDGEETCGGDVAAEIARIQASGIDLRLTIVGFAIDDAALSETFAAWAKMGGGQYLPAGDAAGLASAIDAATQPRYALERLFLDGRTAPAGGIGLGEARDLPAGRYRLVPLQTAQGEALTLFLEPGSTQSLTYTPTTGLNGAIK